jgi:CheY-like chemotaxis protein
VQNGKILIVDDNPTNLKVLTGCLSGHNYKLLTANTGERCLMAAEKELPDLILLDINLPGINGFEVCRRLKANPLLSSIPVIFLSALDDLSSKLEGFASGGLDYITKPFQKDEVVIRVDTQLKIANLTKKLELSIQHMHESINYAARIQRAVMPPIHSLSQYFPESFVIYEPRDIVSGDFYWWHLRRNLFFLVVADCTGHGVPGAFMSLIGTNALSKFVEEGGVLRPAAIISEIDNEIQTILNQHQEDSEIKDGMEMVVFAFNLQEGIFNYASAKRPVWLYRNEEIHKLNYDRFPIGGGNLYPSKDEFSNYTFEFQSGDTLYLFSDGFTDQFGGPNNKKYTTSQLKNTLAQIQHLPMQQQQEILLSSIHEWQGTNDQTDDRLMIGVRLP